MLTVPTAPLLCSLVPHHTGNQATFHRFANFSGLHPAPSACPMHGHADAPPFTLLLAEPDFLFRARELSDLEEALSPSSKALLTAALPALPVLVVGLVSLEAKDLVSVGLVQGCALGEGGVQHKELILSLASLEAKHLVSSITGGGGHTIVSSDNC